MRQHLPAKENLKTACGCNGKYWNLEFFEVGGKTEGNLLFLLFLEGLVYQLCGGGGNHNEVCARRYIFNLRLKAAEVDSRGSL